jgi:hypothetical protein
MLKGFIDETQKHDGERFTGVGGFLFQEESLTGFQMNLPSGLKV